MPIIGSAEYQFVEVQAAGRALCPFCAVWHNSGDGLPQSGHCLARYSRRRKIAITVRGLQKARGAGFRAPSSEEVESALVHATASRK